MDNLLHNFTEHLILLEMFTANKVDVNQNNLKNNIYTDTT